jgi:hypothetical protein
MPENSSDSKNKPQRWFRFYAESLDDPKVQRLPPHLFKTWVNLLSMACSSAGMIRRDDVAFRLRISDHDAATQIDELIGLGLLDILPDGTLEPHNWKVRQFVSDSSNERVRKHREKKKKEACNVTCNESVAPPEQSRADTETESEKTRDVRVDDMPSHVKPVANWNHAFERSDESAGVIRTEAGSIQLVNGTLLRWLEKFGSPARLDLALIEIAGEINPGSRKPLAADVEARLARKVAEKLDKDERYQAAVASNAAAKAAPKRVKLSRWGV